MNKTFKTIEIFQYSFEAQIIKGRLESEGIKVFLLDNLIIDTDSLVSSAIGGVKLKVLSSQKNEAKQILNSISKYSINDDGNAINCPNCNCEKIELYSTVKDIRSFCWFIVGILFSTLPFYTKHKYKCQMCNIEFDIE